MFVPDAHELGLGRLERALELTIAAAPLRAKLREAQRAGTLPRGLAEPELLEGAIAARVLAADERDLVREALEARDEAIRVDDFPPHEYVPHAARPHGPAPSTVSTPQHRS
jgi:hypothetical protein